MSLILEALRKSEAERRLGSAPDLLAPMPVLRAPARRPRWPLWIAGTCILVVAMALAWWWMRATPTTPSTPMTKRSTQPASYGDANNTVAGNAKGEAPQPSIALRTSQPPAITLPVTNVPNAATPAHKSAAALPMPKLAAAPVPPASARASIKATAPKLADESTAMPAPPTIATATPAPAPVDEPALSPLADLSADERNGLPAMKVSMHVYADDPAQRFMIVDGQRVGEGARIAGGVILVHIRRDGAEIDVRGRRLLLPKP
ncbi:MAG TPA: general secretion pathway protein GspB [Xanthomonadaceae bacterium]|nr:general secretion pathway protein GspB [Xanthomonadaceae bacterium]